MKHSTQSKWSRERDHREWHLRTTQLERERESERERENGSKEHYYTSLMLSSLGGKKLPNSASVCTLYSLCG